MRKSVRDKRISKSGGRKPDWDGAEIYSDPEKRNGEKHQFTIKTSTKSGMVEWMCSCGVSGKI